MSQFPTPSQDIRKEKGERSLGGRETVSPHRRRCTVLSLVMAARGRSSHRLLRKVERGERGEGKGEGRGKRGYEKKGIGMRPKVKASKQSYRRTYSVHGGEIRPWPLAGETRSKKLLNWNVAIVLERGERGEGRGERREKVTDGQRRGCERQSS